MNAQKSGNERTKIFRAFMSRLSCVHVQTIVRSPDHRAFMSRPSCVHVQTIVRSSVFPDRVILNARHPFVRSFRSGRIWFRSGTSSWEGTRAKSKWSRLQMFHEGGNASSYQYYIDSKIIAKENKIGQNRQKKTG